MTTLHGALGSGWLSVVGVTLRKREFRVSVRLSHGVVPELSPPRDWWADGVAAQAGREGAPQDQHHGGDDELRLRHG